MDGASIAFHLASRGAPVTVFEQGFWASGPTGRSSGTGFKLAPELGDQIVRLIVNADADLLGPLGVDRPIRIGPLMRT